MKQFFLLHTITFTSNHYFFPDQIYFIGDVYIRLCAGRWALTGLAIGDAMGAPLEGLPPYTKTVTEMESGGIHNRIAGNFTMIPFRPLRLQIPLPFAGASVRMILSGD